MATRLRPLTNDIPKSLIPINGRPFIDHQLQLLARNGITRVVICAGYCGQMLREVVGDGERFGLNVQFSFDGNRPLGTGGALVKALPMLDSMFFVLYGDSYVLCNFLRVQHAFFDSGKQALMTVARNDDGRHRSNVAFKTGCVRQYDKQHQTEQMQYYDYGLGVLKHTALNAYAEQPFDLALLYQQLVAREQLAGFEVDDALYEIGSFRGIAEFQATFT